MTSANFFNLCFRCFAYWSTRLRRFHAPALMLVIFLQRTPVLRLLVPGALNVASGPSGFVLKSAIGLAALGAFDALAGATTFTVISSTGTATGATNATFQITGSVGTPINGTAGGGFSGAGGPPGSETFWGN